MTSVNLTELEKTFVKALEKELYAEYDFSDVDCNDLAKVMGLPVNTIKGIVGSLVKKNIVETYASDCNGKNFELLLLRPEYHKNWASECEKEYIQLYD